MHELGPNSPPPTLTTTDDSELPLWALGLVIALALALAGSLAWVVISADRAQPDAAQYPDEWDKRVAPYVAKVERLRGLDFRHPVRVRFLPAKKFERTVTSDTEQDLTKEEREEIEHFAGTMRAVGLLEGKVDLLASVESISRAGTLAYYSFEDQRITVRGTKVTPQVRATLVHELTHALQDQHFSIGNRIESLRKASADGPDTTAATVLRAVIEGDAERVAARYRATLPPKAQRALAGQEAGAVDRLNRRTKKVPKVITTMFSAPYTFGSGLVQTVAAQGGNGAVDAMFQQPPVLESALLDPLGYVERDLESRPVPVPPVPGDAERFGSGQFGVLTWYLMLAERLPVREALDVADGWGGDSYVSYRTASSSCVRLRYAGTGRATTDRALGSLRRWAAATPATTTVSRGKGVVEVRSCDPGARAPGGKDVSDQAVQLVMTRVGLGLGLLQAKVPPKRAQCLSGRLLDVYSVEQLSDPQFGADDPVVQARVQQLAAGCG